MPLAAGANLSKSFGAESIFRDVAFEIQERDRIALVGANGAGKSTLLRIMAGVERPDTGTVTYTAGTRVAYLPQEVTFPPGVTLREHVTGAFTRLLDIEAELSLVQDRLTTARGDDGAVASLLQRHDRLLHDYETGGGYTYQSRLREVLAGLGIEESRLDQPLETFSAGQRTRAALARLLLDGAGVMLLDEPTNHLDLAAMEWLEDFLAGAPQAVVLISHDRWFLDRVATRIWEMAAGKIERYTGNYSQFAAQRDARRQRALKEYEAQQRHVERTEAFIDRYRAGQRSRQARGRQKHLDRLDRLDKPRDTGGMSLAITSSLRSGDIVLAGEGLVVAAGTPSPPPGKISRPGQPVTRQASSKRPVDESTILFRSDDVELRRGGRVAIVGPNGAGKSTLLRVITGEQEPAAGHIAIGYGVELAYYAQAHEQLRPERTVIEEIVDVRPLGEEQARTYLGRFLFSGDDAFKRVSSLSGGERSRLALARLALDNANFLVLDEPTNHLDLYSREALEQVLAQFRGTILFVSHDRSLVDALATQIWAIEDGVLRVHKCSWAEYVAQRERARDQREAHRRRARDVTAATEAAEAARLRERERARRQSRIERLEAEIATRGAQLHLVISQLGAASARADTPRIVELGSQHDEVAASLAVLEEEWVALHAEIEASAPEALDAATPAG